MLLGRSNKNDYGSQTQQIIWKGLGPTSAGLEPNFPHFPMDSLPGAFPPAKTPRREMLRAGASPSGVGMTSARAGAAIAACSAPGIRVLPSDYTPHQITVWERVFLCGEKKKFKSAWSLWPVLQLSGAPTRAEAPGDPGAKPRPWGSTCRSRQQGIKHTDPARLDQTPH